MSAGSVMRHPFLRTAAIALAGAAALVHVAAGRQLRPSGTPRVEIRQLDTPLPGARSPRNANYSIDVRLDHPTRTLTGSAGIGWRNIGRAPATDLKLHLYWNAWRNTGSSW